MEMYCFKCDKETEWSFRDEEKGYYCKDCGIYMFYNVKNLKKQIDDLQESYDKVLKENLLKPDKKDIEEKLDSFEKTIKSMKRSLEDF